MGLGGRISRGPRSVCNRRHALAAIGTGVAGLAGCLDLRSTSDDSDGGTPEETLFVEDAIGRGFEYEYADDGGIQQNFISNAGVYVADVTNNGREDVFAIGGKTPTLFLNEGGEFTRDSDFPTITEPVRGALFFDHNNSGFVDLLLLISQSEPITLLNTDGTFEAGDIGFDDILEQPVSATAGDLTGDGYLDVFIAQNGNWASDRPRGSLVGSVDTDNGQPNVLYRNTGGTFHRDHMYDWRDDRWSLVAGMADLTGSGYPDIYVANDFNYDVLYRNSGGRLTAREIPDSDRNAMSVSFVDLTDNGHLDVFVTNIFFDEVLRDNIPSIKRNPVGNNLFLNDGAGNFEDNAGMFGVAEGGWGWASLIEDFHNDGHPSIIHTTSILDIEGGFQAGTEMTRDEIKEQYPYAVYPAIFEYVDEQQFQPVHPTDWGFHPSNGRGMIALDVDQSGVLDIAIADADGAYKFYQNSVQSNHWLRIAVQGGPDRPRLGARVIVETESDRQVRVIHANSDFLSQQSRIAHVGLGDADHATVVVTWPDGTEYRFTDVEADQQVSVSTDGTYNTVYSA